MNPTKLLLPLVLLLAGQLRAVSHHFDPRDGDDLAGDGSPKAPWRSLAKASSLALGPGDEVLLRAGRSWSGEHLELSCAGSAQAPIRIGRYGEGADPLIDFADTGNPEGEAWGLRLLNCAHVTVSDLRIRSGRWPAARLRSGVWVLAQDASAVLEGITLRRIHVSEVYGNSRRCGGINFHVRLRGGGGESVLDGILIEDCTVEDVADTGIQLMTDALLEGNAWQHKYDAFRHVVIRGCRVDHVLRDGILVRASSGALLERNVLNRVGYLRGEAERLPYLPHIDVVAALWPYYSDRVLMRYNEAYGTRRLAADGQAWDFDVGVTNSVYEFNYSQDNEGGCLLVMNDTRGNIFRHNVSHNDHGDLIDVQEDGVLIEDNVFLRGPGVSPGAYFSGNARRFGSKRITYRRNHFINLSGSPYYRDGKSVYEDNVFLGLHPSSEPADKAAPSPAVGGSVR